MISQNDWVKVADFSGGQRERAVAFTIGDRGYVATGQDTADAVKNDLWEYDPGTDTWTQKADFPGVARRDAVAFVIDEKGYVGTGMNHAESSFGERQKDFYRYHPGSNSWASIAEYPGNSGTGIYFASAFATLSRGYVCCGKRGPSSYSDELYEYDPAADTWTAKAIFPGTERYGTSAFSIGDVGYIGLGADEDFFRNDVFCYDILSDSWQQVADFPGSERYSGIGFSIDGRGFMGLGTDGGFKDDMYEYNPETDTWDQKASYPASERRSCAAFVVNGKAYVGTGKGVTGTKRSMYRYAPYFFELPGEESSPEFSVNIYPNPVKQEASFVFENINEPSLVSCSVFDGNGKLVHTFSDIENNSINFSRKNLPAGIYYFNAYAGNKIVSGKLLLL